LTTLSVAGRMLQVPLVALAPGQGVRVRVPAREVILATEAPGAISIHNIVPGLVGRIVEDAQAHAALVEICLDEAGLLARVTADAVRRLGLVSGMPVLALVKSVAIEVLGDA
jgi:molybdate transport system ATP-binding protein